MELTKYCVGKGLNIGCGDVWIGNSIGVDSNPNAKAVMIVDRADKLGSIPPASEDKGRYDYIVSAACFEHIDRGPIMVLRRWLQILKLGGVIAITVPDAEYGIWAMTGDNGAVGKFVKKDRGMEHLHAFTVTSLKLLFEFAGMEVIRCEVLDRRPVRPERTIICVGRKMEAYG